MNKIDKFPEKLYLVSCGNEIIFKEEVSLLKNNEKFAAYIYKNKKEVMISLKEINRLYAFLLIEIKEIF